MTPAPPDLTISIINHSNPALLHECLRSLFAATHDTCLDVWVVDNATDGAGVPAMQAEFPQVRWLFNTDRQGFSANHNQVLCQATGRYACILNDDTIIHDQAFDALVEYMDENPKVGMAGARLLNGDGTQQNCTFRFSSLGAEAVANCLLPKSLNSIKAKSIDDAQFRVIPTQVDWVLGACIVIRRETLHQVGLLDVVLSPIGNGEEVDWCFRAHKAGWGVAYCPNAVITHYGGQSFKLGNPGVDRTRIEAKKTSIRFAHKHFGPATALLVRAIFVFTLPWNLFMLTQTLLRRRMFWTKYKADVITYLAIAKTGMSRI